MYLHTKMNISDQGIEKGQTNTLLLFLWPWSQCDDLDICIWPDHSVDKPA